MQTLNRQFWQLQSSFIGSDGMRSPEGLGCERDYSPVHTQALLEGDPTDL